MFFEEGSELREVCPYTFHETGSASAMTCLTLKFFEFIDSIRIIGNQAFRDVPLEMPVI